MNNKIVIDNDIIKYCSKEYSSNYDKSWSLKIRDIKIIGAINRMQGDEDSLFLIFIDKSNKEYYMNTSKLINGFDDFIYVLKEKFNINFEKLDKLFNFKPMVIYPEAYKNINLYEFDIFHLLKRMIGINHIASGKVNNKLLK